MNQYQGFLIKKNGRVMVNSKKTTSIITNQLQADYLNNLSYYLKGRLMDLGCGERPYRLIYDEFCEDSIGVDVETCIHDQKLVDIFASADDMPFENASFDTILCTNVLEHVANMEKAFSEISRVIKSGGYLIMSVPFLYPAHEIPHDFYRFTRYGIEHQLEKNGFVVEHMLPWGGIGILSCVYFHFFFGKIIKNKCINNISCLIQKGTYFIIKKCCFKRLLAGKGKASKIITLGNFVVARKGR